MDFQIAKLEKQNQDKCKFGKCKSGKMQNRNLDKWIFGNLEKWKHGKMKIGKMEIYGNGNMEKLEIQKIT